MTTKSSSQKLRDIVYELEISVEQLMMFGQDMPDYSHRYMERNGEYEIRTYKQAVETIGHGKLGEQPEWLKRILDLAYLGEHIEPIPNPPPDKVLWFRTDRELNLLSFESIKPTY